MKLHRNDKIQDYILDAGLVLGIKMNPLGVRNVVRILGMEVVLAIKIVVGY